MPFRRLLFPLLLLAASPHARAQCMSRVYGLGIEDATGKPFQADVQFTSPLAQGSASLEPRNAHMARDSQGRTRVDRNDGKYKVASGVGEGAEVEQHHIDICDPVAQQSITLDTLNKSATVHKAAANNVGVHRAYIGGFCNHQIRVVPPNSAETVEDLGHRTIEGFDAVGTLQKHTVPNSFTNATGTTVKQLTSTSEVWCSQELGAVLLRITGTVERGASHTATVSNIQRTNPDPALFQTPPDYRVVEKVDDPSPRPRMLNPE
jgi:hypothetical protein